MILLTAINMLVLLGTANSFGLRLNVTESYPLGFYRVQEGHWSLNDLVELCLPDDVGQLALEREYLPKSAQCNGVVSVIKKVVAVAGDQVDVSNAVAVNGNVIANSDLRQTDPQGNALNKAQSGVIGPNKAWVMSVHVANSFDSRYFGAISTELIRHRLEPLWIF